MNAMRGEAIEALLCDLMESVRNAEPGAGRPSAAPLRRQGRADRRAAQRAERPGHVVHAPVEGGAVKSTQITRWRRHDRDEITKTHAVEGDVKLARMGSTPASSTLAVSPASEACYKYNHRHDGNDFRNLVTAMVGV